MKKKQGKLIGMVYRIDRIGDDARYIPVTVHRTKYGYICLVGDKEFLGVKHMDTDYLAAVEFEREWNRDKTYGLSSYYLSILSDGRWWSKFTPIDLTPKWKDFFIRLDYVNKKEA